MIGSSNGQRPSVHFSMQLSMSTEPKFGSVKTAFSMDVWIASVVHKRDEKKPQSVTNAEEEFHDRLFTS